MKALIFSLSLLVSSHAFAGLLNKPIFNDILPPNTGLDCRLPADENYGYVFRRDSADNASIEVRGKNGLEGEQSMMHTKVDFKNAPFTLYFKVLARSEGSDYGNYIEFMIDAYNPSGMPSLLARAFNTEVIFTKNADGTETETRKPLMNIQLICAPLE